MLFRSLPSFPTLQLWNLGLRSVAILGMAVDSGSLVFPKQMKRGKLEIIITLVHSIFSLSELETLYFQILHLSINFRC